MDYSLTRERLADDIILESPFDYFGGADGLSNSPFDATGFSDFNPDEDSGEIPSDIFGFVFDELEKEGSGRDFFRESAAISTNLFAEGRHFECDLLMRAFVLSYLDVGHPDKVILY